MEPSSLSAAASAGSILIVKLSSFLPTLLQWSVLGCVIVALYWYYPMYGYFKKMGLSGPMPLPIVGNMGTVLRKSLAYVDMENIKVYGKVYGQFRRHMPEIMIADADIVKIVLVKDFSSFMNRPPLIIRAISERPLDRALFFITDDHWKHVRATLSPTFTSGRLKQMLPTIDECTKTLLTYLDCCKGNDVNVREILNAFGLDVIAGTAFGLESRSLDTPWNPFLKHLLQFSIFGSGRLVKRTLAVVAAFLSRNLAVLLEKVGICFFDPANVEYVENVVARILESTVSAEGRQNFISLCRSDHININQVEQGSVRSTADGKLWTTKGLTTGDIVSNSVLFLQAGLDTVSSFLSFFCYEMAINPQAQQRVYSELKMEHFSQSDLNYESLKDMHYLDMCMDEALRMYPPILRLTRQCNRDTDIGATRVTRGISISILVYALHHDPDYWPEPYTFLPERFLPEAKANRHPFAYLPFGTGPRHCIGMRLALLEAKAAIVRILATYKICPCEGTPNPPLKLGASLGALKPQKPIILRFVRRHLQE